jgi:hypothetical protein
MAGSRILFPQFRNEQSDSKYPFADTATLRAANANLTLNKSVFIDATFYIIGGGARVFLSRVIVAETQIRFVVETTAPAVTASAAYDWRTPPDNGVLALYDEFGRPAGLLLADINYLREFSSWAAGSYVFGATAAEFVATTFIPAKEPGVRAIKTAAGDFLTNDVWLIGDGGVVLRFEEPNIIRVDIVGIPLFRRFACAGAENVFPPKRFVKTINGCPPDEYGNFTLTASAAGLPDGRDDTILRIYPTTSGLVVDAIGRSNT